MPINHKKATHIHHDGYNAVGDLLEGAPKTQYLITTRWRTTRHHNRNGIKMADYTNTIKMVLQDETGHELKVYIRQVKKLFDKKDFSRFIEIYKNISAMKDFAYDNVDAIYEEQWCLHWRGYNVATVKQAWENIKNIAERLGLGCYGNNEFFNKIREGLTTLIKEEDDEKDLARLKELEQFLADLLATRILIGTAMVRKSLI